MLKKTTKQRHVSTIRTCDLIQNSNAHFQFVCKISITSVLYALESKYTNPNKSDMQLQVSIAKCRQAELFFSPHSN